MTTARAYLELARLQMEGWFVAVLPGIGGEVMVTAARGDASVTRQGACVADVVGGLVDEARCWWPSRHDRPSPLRFAG